MASTKQTPYFIAILLGLAFLCFTGKSEERTSKTTTYFIDSKKGNDKNSGTDKRSPWKTLSKLSRTTLRPGDSVCFKRGSSFTGTFIIGDSGTQDRYIVITDYGSKKDPAPSFSNPVFSEGNYGNCIRIKGSYVKVQNLYFTGTPAYRPISYQGEGWVVWEMGAIHIERGARHCLIRNNDIKDCVAGIRSNAEYVVIEGNYIHDCNRVLKQWNWGPLGIWLGADHQEVRYNRIINYSAVDPRIGWGPDSYGSGADGGAIEIDDARFDKSDISIHHNYTRDCQGFLEVTWTDVKQRPAYRNFRIHHNVSDDYQQFIALWWGKDCRIENNTIIRRKVNANEWGVFNITQPNSHNQIRNNIVVTENDVVVFNVGRKGTARPGTVISNNLYFAARGTLNIGKEGPGDFAQFGNPSFRNYKHAQSAEEFAIAVNSPACNKGLDIGYEKDFAGTKIPQGHFPDIGAFECKNVESISLIPLAQNGRALASIQMPANPTTTERFAADELRLYLKKITGADFYLNYNSGSTISLEKDKQLNEEAYSISIKNKALVLSGGSDRGVLYAVYEFLKRLGCRFIAPRFDFYNGFAEYVPKKEMLSYDASEDLKRQPAFAYRKIDVEEGRSHNVDNLLEIIDWMPKAGFNILMVPLNYQGAGRVKWENWREVLTPELKKRGLLIEVGGHGYQNFLNAGMENGDLFYQHPEWFGKNKDCKADALQNLVFNTSDNEAVDYFTQNILKYLKEHPEVDIFDFWPPDGARWNECPQFLEFGSAINRQADLVNRINAAIKKLRSSLQLEIIAYGQVLLPPDKKTLDPDVLVDICPIDQSFEKPIFDTSRKTNKEYAKAILNWRDHFSGNIGLYSYYRKYAWRSLPVILPHYIQSDLKWLVKLPLQGISSYAEPDDWFTYELNYYCLAGLAWDPDLSVDSLVEEYCKIRFDKEAKVAREALTCLEDIVRSYSSIPFTSLKPAIDIARAKNRLVQMEKHVSNALRRLTKTSVSSNLTRLDLMINYVIQDMNILYLVARGASATEVEDATKQMVVFLQANSGKGVFLVSMNENLRKFLKNYSSNK